MSNHVSSLVRSRNLGLGLTGKAVMLLMSEFSSDDGSGIWASKATMAKELETSERTIQRTIKTLIAAGFVREIGRRKHRNGETYEYQIEVFEVSKQPKIRKEPPTEGRPSTQDVGGPPQDVTPDTPSPPTVCHPTPDTPSPHGATECRPNHSKPHRTSGSGGAGEIDPDDLLMEVMAAVGLKSGRIPTYWIPPAATIRVMKWHTDLGLTQSEIIEVARSSRQQFSDPPNGPNALNRAMEQMAAAKSAPPMSATQPKGSRHDQRFGDQVHGLAKGLSEGSVQLDTRSRDPFAS